MPLLGSLASMGPASIPRLATPYKFYRLGKVKKFSKRRGLFDVQEFDYKINGPSLGVLSIPSGVIAGAVFFARDMRNFNIWRSNRLMVQVQCSKPSVAQSIYVLWTFRYPIAPVDRQFNGHGTASQPVV